MITAKQLIQKLLDKRYCFFHKRKIPSIFPLSANPSLDTNDMIGLDVYKSYLKKAFQEKRICNIVITGDFGVGKSSVIRSFEKSYRRLRIKRDFLHISLGDFMEENQLTGAVTTQNGNNSLNGNQTNESNQSVLERRILLQIYSRFHQKDLPASSFRLIQEHGWFVRNATPLLCGFMTMAILLLSLHEPIGHLLSTNFSYINSSVFNGRFTSWLGVVLNNIDILKSWGRMILYLLAILFASIATFLIVRRELPKLQAKAITIKSSSIEASYESAACDSYIDQHATDIVYCLEQIAKQISYTVVFEDIDRLGTKECLEIFTRLREINYLVNLRLAKKHKHLRFVYIANDGLISCLKQSKFFDYIMPVFPRAC